MAQYKLPNPISEQRSDQRERDTLLNALRKAFLQLTGGGALGLAQFSGIIGRGDVSPNNTGTETIVGAFEMPAAYPTFNVTLTGQGEDATGVATFRVRLGGTYGVATSGTVVAVGTASTPSFARVVATGVVIGNTSTLLQITMQSSGAGHLAQFRGGFVLGN